MIGGMVRIVVRVSYIFNGYIKLIHISNKVSKKKITKKVVGSKGEMVDSMNELINELNLLGNDIGMLMGKNARLVKNIGDSFEKMDEQIAWKFRG